METKDKPISVEEMLRGRGLSDADIQLHKLNGTDLQELLEADIFSHHSAYKNVISQQELFDAGQHWSDWE